MRLELQSNPIIPSPSLTLQFIKIASCHDRYPRTTIENKHIKYDPQIDTLKQKGWKINSPVTIMPKA